MKLGYKFIYIVITAVFLLGVYSQFFAPALAQNDSFNIEQPKGAYGFRLLNPGSGCPSVSAEGAVESILKSVAAILFTIGAIGVLLFFLWGAVEWIFSGGDKEKVASARKRMTHAVIGLFLLSISYLILRVVSAVSGFDIFGQLTLPGFGEVQKCT